MSAVWNTDNLWQAGETSWSISKHRVVMSWDSYDSKQHSVVPSQIHHVLLPLLTSAKILRLCTDQFHSVKEFMPYGLKCFATQTVWQYWFGVCRNYIPHKISAWKLMLDFKTVYLHMQEWNISLKNRLT